jgi:hypothetical protein
VVCTRSNVLSKCQLGPHPSIRTPVVVHMLKRLFVVRSVQIIGKHTHICYELGGPPWKLMLALKVRLTQTGWAVGFGNVAPFLSSLFHTCKLMLHPSGKQLAFSNASAIKDVDVVGFTNLRNRALEKYELLRKEACVALSFHKFASHG